MSYEDSKPRREPPQADGAPERDDRDIKRAPADDVPELSTLIEQGRRITEHSRELLARLISLFQDRK